MRGMMSAGWKVGVGADCTVFGTSDEKAGRGNGEGLYLLVDLLACIWSEKNKGAKHTGDKKLLASAANLL